MTDSYITLIGIVMLVAASAFFVRVLMSRRTRVGYTELGTMGDQWLAEHRSNDRPY
jgi:hypothetical protein